MSRPALFALLALAAAAPAPAAESRDPRALAVVERMLANLGGADAPYRARSIAFTFAVEKDGAVAVSRRHEWHPGTGFHRLEATSAEGQTVVVEWNIHSRQGKVQLAGAEVAAADQAPHLERAWKTWVNDTYWLLMPYKLLDSGVSLAHDGVATADGRLFDKVRVTFDKVGLTPGDTYWAFIARDSGLMERWAFVLEGQRPPPVEFNWTETVRAGPLTLALRKEKVGAAQAILTHRLRVE